MTLPAPAPPPWQRWDLHPSVIIGLALLGGLYVYWGGLEAPRRRVASFAAALAVLGLALNGPVHNLSDSYLFSAHMAQHLVLTLVFPPLLLYGTPAWVVRPLLGSAAEFQMSVVVAANRVLHERIVDDVGTGIARLRSAEATNGGPTP